MKSIKLIEIPYNLEYNRQIMLLLFPDNLISFNAQTKKFFIYPLFLLTEMFVLNTNQFHVNQLSCN